MWKKPFRPAGEVSQDFNDGVLKVFTVSDVAVPGRQPVEALGFKVKLRYAERRLGIQRYYSAFQNQKRVERVLRVPRTGDITSQDVVITEDGKRYRIDLVQSVDGVFPPCLDLTLVAYKQLSESDNGEE